MTSPVLPFLLLFTATPMIPGAGPADRAFMQLTIHQRIVIRIPRVFGGRRDPRVPPEETHWVEKKGPKCVPMLAIAGAIITATDSVDLLVADGTRLRAKFDDKCPALDYYSGLYIKGTADGMVCAERDSIRARSGSSCQIDKFKRLTAKR
jgi:hypothetical protein